VRIIGTAPVARMHVINNNKYVHQVKPQQNYVSIETGESYYRSFSDRLSDSSIPMRNRSPLSGPRQSRTLAEGTHDTASPRSTRQHARSPPGLRPAF